MSTETREACYRTLGLAPGAEKVQLLPATPINPVPVYFTVGSSKDEVLAVQGTPTK